MYGCNSIPYQTHALSDRNKQIYIGMVAIESLENRKYRRKDNNNTNNIFSFTNYITNYLLEITKEILNRSIEVIA